MYFSTGTKRPMVDISSDRCRKSCKNNGLFLRLHLGKSYNPVGNMNHYKLFGQLGDISVSLDLQGFLRSNECKNNPQRNKKVWKIVPSIDGLKFLLRSNSHQNSPKVKKFCQFNVIFILMSVIFTIVLGSNIITSTGQPHFTQNQITM